MLRTLVLAAVFFGITLALILLQPAPDLHFSEREQMTTRASADVTAALAVAAAPVSAAPPQPDALLAPVQSSAEDSDLRLMTQGVLAGLGIAPLTQQAPASDRDSALRDMSLSALNGLRSVTGQQATAETPLQSLILQALRAGQSDAYIDSLLNEAASMGRIAVPPALITVEGRVDTHVILSTIIAQAQPEAAGSASGDARAVPQAGASTGQDFHTVGPGDSLGSIAARFYGDAALYSSIFEANRALLSSPDKLRVGQRLVIPTIN